jgi:hypothetical protein
MVDYVTDAGTYVGDPVTDYVKAPQMVQTMIETGASKKDLSAGQIFVRGMYGGALLAFATAISFWATAQALAALPATRRYAHPGGVPACRGDELRQLRQLRRDQAPGATFVFTATSEWS